MILLYVVGPPAAGKSTLMAELTAGADRMPCVRPVPHDVLVHPGTGEPVGCELGRRRPAFPGTDALSYDAAPRVLDWLGHWPFRLVLGEGDRLGYPAFLVSVAAAGYTPVVVHLSVNPDVLDARCAGRGSNQSPRWRKGRATKAASLALFARTRGYTVIELDATAKPAELADAVRGNVDELRALP